MTDLLILFAVAMAVSAVGGNTSCISSVSVTGTALPLWRWQCV